MANEEIILLNNQIPLVNDHSITKRAAEGCYLADNNLYTIPMYDANENLMHIPILKNYKPSQTINSYKEAIYESHLPMDEDDSRQLEYLQNAIKGYYKPMIKANRGEEITITGLSKFTYKELYFINYFIQYLGFPSFEKDVVTFKMY